MAYGIIFSIITHKMFKKNETSDSCIYRCLRYYLFKYLLYILFMEYETDNSCMGRCLEYSLFIYMIYALFTKQNVTITVA